MKNFFSYIILCFIILANLPQNTFASDTGYFIVTAYYSPLPNQNYYITGDYESEKRLNGNGIAGASGKKVFSGMLAAPQKYAFGTKIQLDGLGVGSVEDRGGAIVPAGERGYGHDRIDIWVGYGDEGLRRAMYWGKRKIAGRVVSTNSEMTMDYDTIPAPSWAVPKTTKLYGKKVIVSQNNNQKTVEEINIFSHSLGKGSNALYIIELQEVLKEIGYYTEDNTTGKYDVHTIDAVYNFQINKNIVENEHTKGAGSYGPKTREELQKVYNLFLEEKKQQDEIKKQVQKIKEESIKQAKEYISSLGNPKYGEISGNVRRLQKMLSKLGYFDYKDTAIYGVKTHNALLEFQLQNNIIDSLNSKGAGVFGPKTKDISLEKLGEYYFSKNVKARGLSQEYGNISPNKVSQIKQFIFTI